MVNEIEVTIKSTFHWEKNLFFKKEGDNII